MTKTGSTDLRRQLALGIWTAMALATAVLISRRLGGALSAPIPVELAVLWSCVKTAGCVAAAWLYRQNHAEEPAVAAPDHRMSDRISAVVGVTALLAVVPSWNAEILGVFCGIGLLIGVGFWVASADLLVLMMHPAASNHPPEAPRINAATIPEPAGASSIEISDPQAAPTQTQVRHNDFGAERIEGTVHVQFAKGQRDLAVHIAICPPLSQIPEVEVEDLDGNDWEVKVAAAYAYGLRLSVRRQAEGPADGEIGYSAVATTVRAVA